ncbi:MAG: tetratricopeptide repeat protein [Flavobacteriales bacterium]|nr:tetratricopeptide repeat protein [Flavobacteriales bacterium]
MKLLWHILILCVFLIFNNGYSQEYDELILQLKNPKSESAKLKTLVLLSDACEIDEIEKFSTQAIELADKIVAKNKDNKDSILSLKATAINNLAYLYHLQSKIEKAVLQYKASMVIFEEIKDYNGMAMTYNNLAMIEKDLGHIDTTLNLLGKALQISKKTNNINMLQMTHTNYSSIYIRMGLITEALEHSFFGLEIQEKSHNDYGKGYALNNIGSIYFMQRDLKKAEEFFLKSLKVRESINDEVGVATVYNNLAKVYDEQDKNDKALEFYIKCLEKRNLLENKEGVAQSYSNLGSFYLKIGNHNKTKEYYQKAIEIRENIFDKEGLANSYEKMAAYNYLTNNIKEAEKYGLKSYRMAETLGFMTNLESTTKILSEIYEKMGNEKKAYQMFKLHIKLRDSLFNQETQKNLLTQQINYDYNKKKLTDSIAFAKEQEVKDLAIAKQEAQLQKEKSQRIALYGGLSLVIVFAGLMYNRFRVTQKQKIIIEKQKELVEEKQKEIIDSIKYAKRIQDALLTPFSYIERNISNLKK